MKPHGARVKEYFESEGIKFSSAAEKLGKHRNTLKMWMDEDVLDKGKLSELADAYPDIITVFPEIEWNMERSSHLLESEEVVERLASERYRLLHQEYVKLLERHNRCLERLVCEKK